MNFKKIEDKALKNKELTKDEALSILESSDEVLMDLVSSAKTVRERFFGKKMKLNYLVNVKSGICPEDCHYCSQSKDSKAPIEKYPLMSSEEVIAQAERGLKVGAVRACLVASGRGPSETEVNQFCDSVEKLKEKYPTIEVCACMGLLQKGQGEKLKKSGVHAYNHNINTSKEHYEKICGTHTYDNRLNTMETVKKSGMESCSGVLSGMGETNADLVEMAFTLRERNVESIPVNFLIPIDKTPMSHVRNLTPQRCLRILALFRLVNPTAELRIAGGREINLKTLQPLGFMIANSIFIGDYLTTQGQDPTKDLEIIQDLGYQVLGQPKDFLQKTLGVKSGQPTILKREREMSDVRT